MKKVKPIANDYKDEEIDLISNTFNITPISSKILLNRKLKTLDEINQFLHPDFEYFENPMDFKDLDKGCKRILEAIKKHENILIYGDYDVDGVTSISQFYILLKQAGIRVSYYVPEREAEGYGISSDFVEGVKSGSIAFDLLITVDCGIAEVEKIGEINRLNKEVIVLDHHQCGEILPPAYAIINPKQKDCPSINKQLCAAGLSFKFLRHLNSFLKIENVENKLLELACLGTVADIVDLVGDNRIITYYGLKGINNSQLPGVVKLVEKAAIKDKKIESFHIGYILAPRINAAGRMSTAHTAIKLMLTESEEEAELLSEELERLNILRKEEEHKIFNEAVVKIENDCLFKRNIIVVDGEKWHEGVLGIVASKITEKYDKPAIVISVKDGIGKGSSRSFPYLDIYEVLRCADKYLIKYGGHRLAAGLTIRAEDISPFSNEINKCIDNIDQVESEFKDVEVDGFIELKDIDFRLYDEIYSLEPFGHGNPKPVFAVKNAELLDIKRVGANGNHLSFRVSDNERDVSVIGFGKLQLLEKILTKPSSYIVSINDNEFRGNRSLQLILSDVEGSESLEYIPDLNKLKMIKFLINKSKSKIIKIGIFELVEKINKLYNTKITAEEIVCILKKDNSVQYILREEILYIKK